MKNLQTTSHHEDQGPPDNMKQPKTIISLIIRGFLVTNNDGILD